MTQKSEGSGASSGEWNVAGSSFDDYGVTGSVFFISDSRPGIWLSLTLVLDGTETVTGVEIRLQHPERPADAAIGTRLLRSVPLGELAHEAMKELRDRADRAASPQFAANQEQALLRALALRSKPIGHKRPGRRGRPPEYYARLAVEYERWRQTGDRLAVLARQENMSESALRAALNTARSKGFLTQAPRGRAGGSATEEAKAVLRTARE
ncbi:hypothetical protein [Streptomyces sp. NPDC088789]|uniref:hypothetical protein n=1 Tax=Streptomyces sp. NPDC088789 TaxID=3365899 RepID=UPI0037F5037F